MDAENEKIDAAIKALSTSGFINYFGLQRFGTSAGATHLIGRAILKADYREVRNNT